MDKHIGVRLEVSRQAASYCRQRQVELRNNISHIKIMFDPSSFANPTPLAHADTSRDVLPRGGTSHRKMSMATGPQEFFRRPCLHLLSLIMGFTLFRRNLLLVGKVFFYSGQLID
ncbi:hypothetical protein TNCV_4311001 [Trichonephila clavipes]|nr:hypothetical protein TNCV_4311001 [Trichonephila clavipes]